MKIKMTVVMLGLAVVMSACGSGMTSTTGEAPMLPGGGGENGGAQLSKADWEQCSFGDIANNAPDKMWQVDHCVNAPTAVAPDVQYVGGPYSDPINIDKTTLASVGLTYENNGKTLKTTSRLVTILDRGLATIGGYPFSNAGRRSLSIALKSDQVKVGDLNATDVDMTYLEMSNAWLGLNPNVTLSNVSGSIHIDTVVLNFVDTSNAPNCTTIKVGYVKGSMAFKGDAVLKSDGKADQDRAIEVNGDFLFPVFQAGTCAIE